MPIIARMELGKYTAIDKETDILHSPRLLATGFHAEPQTLGRFTSLRPLLLLQ